MRIDGGKAQCSIDAGLELFRDGVLQALRLVVDFVPRIAQCLGQIEFQQTMVTHDFECGFMTGSSQFDATIALVLDELEVGQALDHAGDGGRSHAETFSD